MILKEVKKLIKNLLLETKERTPILLLGVPGIGKTEIVNQISEEVFECSAIDIDLSITQPEDLLGVPVVKEDYYTYAINERWKPVFEKGSILFFDEFTNINRDDILSSTLKILHDRKIGQYTLHPDVQVILAGNSPDDSSLANELPTPLMNRIIKINVEPPSVDDWINYMDTNHKQWDRRIAGYLKSNKENFIKIPKSNTTLETYPTPRSWTNLATKPKEFVEKLSHYIVGEQTGRNFTLFISKNIPTVDEMIESNFSLWDNLDVSGKYLFSSNVSSLYNDNDKVLKVIDKLSEIDAENSVVCISMLETMQRELIIKKLIRSDNKVVSIIQKMSEE